MEYCPGGELFFHLKRLKRFKEHDTQFYVAEVGCALNHLHCLGIIYRDLKVRQRMVRVRGGYTDCRWLPNVCTRTVL